MALSGFPTSTSPAHNILKNLDESGLILGGVTLTLGELSRSITMKVCFSFFAFILISPKAVFIVFVVVVVVFVVVAFQGLLP